MVNPDQFLLGAHEMGGEELAKKLEAMSMVMDASRAEEKKGQQHKNEMRTGTIKHWIRITVVTGVIAGFVLLGMLGCLDMIGVAKFDHIDAIKSWWGHFAAAISSGTLMAFLDGKTDNLILTATKDDGR